MSVSRAAAARSLGNRHSTQDHPSHQMTQRWKALQNQVRYKSGMHLSIYLHVFLFIENKKSPSFTIRLDFHQLVNSSARLISWSGAVQVTYVKQMT